MVIMLTSHWLKENDDGGGDLECDLFLQKYYDSGDKICKYITKIPLLFIGNTIIGRAIITNRCKWILNTSVSRGYTFFSPPHQVQFWNKGVTLPSPNKNYYLLPHTKSGPFRYIPRASPSMKTVVLLPTSFVFKKISDTTRI